MSTIPQNPSPINPNPTPLTTPRDGAQINAAPPARGDGVEIGQQPVPAVCPFAGAATGSAPAETAAPAAPQASAAAPAPPPAAPAPPPAAPQSVIAVVAGAQPVTGWQDPPATSAADRQAFQAQVTELQQRLLDAGKVDHISRGFHQKQNWGGKATVTFDPAMPASMRKEAFANVAGKSFTAAIRFSNGQGCPHADKKGDVRGMAAKLNINGQEIDILATNHITFARDAKQFMKFAEIAEVMQADGNLAAIHELISGIHKGEYSGKETARIAGRLAADTRKKTQHIAKETYWSQAVKVGDLVGRFVFTPESGAESKRGWFPEENYLREGMEHDLEKGDIKMKIAFEAFTDDEVATDASVHGEHITYPVGEVVFEKRAASSAARTAEEEAVDKMSFNPSNGIRMAGTMNESNRAAIYEQSATNRGASHWDSPEVASFFGRTPAAPSTPTA